MSVTIPPVLVLIVCKVISGGAPDQNSTFTNWMNLDWATENSMMTCERHEVQLYDPAEDQGALPLNPDFSDWAQCARAGMRLAMDWDAKHAKTNYRVWRIGCPAKIIDDATGAIIGYKLPECGHKETVICSVDSVI